MGSENLLDQAELKDKALQEETTGWDSHELKVGAHSCVDEVLPEEVEVPDHGDREGDQRCVLGRLHVGHNFPEVRDHRSDAQDYTEELAHRVVERLGVQPQDVLRLQLNLYPMRKAPAVSLRCFKHDPHLRPFLSLVISL